MGSAVARRFGLSLDDPIAYWLRAFRPYHLAAQVLPLRQLRVSPSTPFGRGTHKSLRPDSRYRKTRHGIASERFPRLR
jgi:hypothetical protein